MQAPTVASELYPWFSGNPADINGATGDFSFASQGTFRDFGSTNLMASPTANQWHEYAITLDTTPSGTGMKLYEDYTLVDSTTTAAVAFLNTDFVLGKDFDGLAERHFVGQIAQLSISSGILTPGNFVSEQIPCLNRRAVNSGIGAAALLAVVRRRRQS